MLVSATHRVSAKVSKDEENDWRIEREIKILQAMGNDLPPSVPSIFIAVQLGGRKAFLTPLYSTNLAVVAEKREDKRKPLPDCIVVIAFIFGPCPMLPVKVSSTAI